MRADWDGIALVVVPYKDTGTYVIGGVDEIQALLDDQAVRVAAIRSSPFVAFVADKASKWAEFVETLQVWSQLAGGSGRDGAELAALCMCTGCAIPGSGDALSQVCADQELVESSSIKSSMYSWLLQPQPPPPSQSG